MARYINQDPTQVMLYYMHHSNSKIICSTKFLKQKLACKLSHDCWVMLSQDTSMTDLQKFYYYIFD